MGLSLNPQTFNYSSVIELLKTFPCERMSIYQTYLRSLFTEIFGKLNKAKQYQTTVHKQFYKVAAKKWTWWLGFFFPCKKYCTIQEEKRQKLNQTITALWHKQAFWKIIQPPSLPYGKHSKYICMVYFKQHHPDALFFEYKNISLWPSIFNHIYL